MNRSSILAACRARAGSAALAAGIGVVVSSFYAIAEWPVGFFRTIFIGAVIGVFIYMLISILELLFGSRIDGLAHASVRAAARAVLFVTGGVFGGVLGLVTGVRIFGEDITFAEVFVGRGKAFVVMAAVTGLVSAIAFRAFELLRDRLASTIAQLKDREWAEKELELARAIQTRLLPPELVEGDGFRIAARNLPAHMVAGDFYDFIRLDDGSVVIVAADVAGKGMGASLIMASVKAVLPFVAREGAQRAMAMLNAKLVRELGQREFVALAYAHFQPDTGALEIINAGFPEPYILSPNTVRAIENSGDRLPLGIRDDVAYAPAMANLARGERLVFVSDGIPESPVNGEPLGYERMEAMLVSCGAIAFDGTFIDQFLDLVRNAVDPGLADDWTAVVLER